MGLGVLRGPSSALSPVLTTLAWLSAQILLFRTPAPFPKHRASPARPRGLWAPASSSPKWQRECLPILPQGCRGARRKRPHPAPAPNLSPELRLASSHTFWGLGVFCPLIRHCDPFSSLRAPGLGSLLDAWLVRLPTWLLRAGAWTCPACSAPAPAAVGASECPGSGVPHPLCQVQMPHPSGASTSAPSLSHALPTPLSSALPVG